MGGAGRGEGGAFQSAGEVRQEFFVAELSFRKAVVLLLVVLTALFAVGWAVPADSAPAYRQGFEMQPRSQQNPNRFSRKDRGLIREYFSRYYFNPALQKPSILGHPAKRIERSMTLPPDWGEIPLPVALSEKLSPLPPGYVRFLLGSDVVLMDRRTREVLDVVEDVLRYRRK